MKAVALLRSIFLATMLALLGAGVSGAQAQDPPKELRMAAIVSAGPGSAWDDTFMAALKTVAENPPHGLKFTYRVSDPLWGDDAEKAMRLYAQSGQFDIIWAHSSYSDQVKALKAEFPNIMFVVVGSGNEGLGGNQYWVYKRVYEPAYLLGVLAGKATKSNVIGVVGTYPADDVNDEINAFIDGAKSVNTKLSSKVAFVQSWYDPPKAAELTNAQIAAGADVIFTLADNYAPCDEHKIVCIANFADTSARSPQVLSSPLSLWTKDIVGIIDEWYKHKSDGTPFAGNTEAHWLGMKDGGSDVAPFHGRESLVPADAIAAFTAAKAAFEAGTLTIPLDVSEPKSE